MFGKTLRTAPIFLKMALLLIHFGYSWLFHNSSMLIALIGLFCDWCVCLFDLYFARLLLGIVLQLTQYASTYLRCFDCYLCCSDDVALHLANRPHSNISHRITHIRYCFDGALLDC